MTGLTTSGDCTVSGEKNGLAVRLMMVLVCLDVGTGTVSRPEALWQPLRSFPRGTGPVWPPFISACPSVCPIRTGSVLLLAGGISSLTLSTSSSWISSLASSSSSCSSLTGRKCLSWTTLSSMSSSLWKSLPESSMISPTKRILPGGDKSGLVTLFLKFRSLSFPSLLLSAHVSLLDEGSIFTFSALSSSDPSPQLSSVKALTLCLRRLKSCTPLELELEGMVS